MKKQLIFIPFALLICLSSLYGQVLRPYIVGFETDMELDALKTTLKENLASEGIQVLGEYAPAEDPDRYAIVFTSDELVEAVKSIKGLTGFAAALRIGITKEDEKYLVSFTNPTYWGNAYFRSDFPSVEQKYKELTSKIENTMKKTGDYSGREFGSEKGIEIDDLRKYRYMFGMPRFDSPVELNTFSTYVEAIETIEANSAIDTGSVRLVYSVEIPYDKIKLYGFELRGETGEASFLSKIDITEPKHTAFLPYEVLVVDGKVFMLHGRFRIALSFPDLTMGTFTKIMSTPGDIKDMLMEITE